MNLKPSHIKLKGKKVAVKDLLIKPQSTFQWENDFYVFLKEWYSDELFICVQTSGSTGEPKTIQLKKEFVAASAKRTLDFFKLRENDKVLHCLSTKYIAGKLMLVRALIGKFDLYLIDPASDFTLLEKGDFKFAAMVPNQASKLFKLKNWNLEQLLIGGDAISSKLGQQLQKVKTACYSSYGMTETATHIALRKLNGKNADKYYHCLKDISIQLSENNCLTIFVPGLEKPTLETTDIAKIIDEKTFRILGRSDNIIISGGMKFSPEEIEKKLDADVNFPFMISSAPHEKLGKQIILLVESPHRSDIQSSLETTCKNNLDKFECPRQIVFVEELPKAANGKIKRK